MKKKWLLIVVYTVILCMTVSFAWILDQEMNKGSYLELLYGDDSGNRLVVSPKEVEMSLYVQKNGQWRYVGNSTDKKSDTALFSVEASKVIPHSSIPFRIRLKNTSDETVKIKVTLNGIVCDKTFVDDFIIEDGEKKYKEKVYVSALGSMEYSKYDVITPESVYIPLNQGDRIATDEEKNTVTYNLTLYESIEVPVTPEGEYVELDCYFYFDKDDMGNESKNKDFYVLSFRAVQQ